MNKYLRLITIMLAGLLSGLTLQAQRTIIHAGRLITGQDGKPLHEVSIFIDANRITEVRKGFVAAKEGEQIYDLKEMTVMPGLMDMHVHLESQTSKDKYSEPFRMNEADLALRATQYAEKTLMAGFTTVRDLGGTGINISLRDAINNGYVKGPRIYTSGKALASTGGHADPTNGLNRELMQDPGPVEGVVNGPEEARKAVRQRYKNGADLIKVTATGGVLSVAKDGSGPQFTMEELQAIVETANDYGMHVAAHAHGEEGMRRAVEAGVTSIEHGTMMTEEIMDLMIARGTYLVPTLTAGRTVADSAKIEGYYPAVIVPKALDIGPRLQDTFARAYKRGVKIVFGTDAGVFVHGINAREFELMAEAGMPPMEIIQSATFEAARLLKAEHELGSIGPNMLADIIAVEGNPLENISLMKGVVFIMKDGVVYKHP
jgi:imidazolonepropionase-like amidohydrolase